jgi:SAM-dependent methyltransferase
MQPFRELEYRVLCRLFPIDPNRLSGNAYAERSKLKVLLGDDIFERLRGKTVVDFGCGYGQQTIELAQQGAGRAVGIDIREEVLKRAREKASGIPNVEFLNAGLQASEFADFVLSIDAFEHFAEPEEVLQQIHALLKLGGTLLVCFGPPWLHPFGGHAFSPFPWSHKLFSESALCRWYNAVKGTRLARFEEVSGGLNRMTVARFEALAESSRFGKVSVKPVPIRKLRRFHSRITREFTTAVVRAELVK